MALVDENTEQLQLYLNFLGHNAGKIDGIIGPNTRGALGRAGVENPETFEVTDESVAQVIDKEVVTHAVQELLDKGVDTLSKAEIRSLQTGLTILDENPQSNIDGVMGPITRGAIEKFESEHSVSAGVAAPEVSAPSTPTVTPPSGRTVAYGDSLAVGYASTSNSIINLGISDAGLHTGDVRGLTANLQQIQPGDNVIFSIGTNDLPDGGRIPAGYEQEIIDRIQAIQERGGNVVVVGTSTGQYAGRNDGWENAMNDEFSQMLERTANATGSAFVSTTDLTGNQYRAGDHLHYNGSGYREVTQRALEALEAQQRLAAEITAEAPASIETMPPPAAINPESEFAGVPVETPVAETMPPPAAIDPENEFAGLTDYEIGAVDSPSQTTAEQEQNLSSDPLDLSPEQIQSRIEQAFSFSGSVPTRDEEYALNGGNLTTADLGADNPLLHPSTWNAGSTGLSFTLEEDSLAPTPASYALADQTEFSAPSQVQGDDRIELGLKEDYTPRNLQRGLLMSGYDIGRVDGVLGFASRTAIADMINKHPDSFRTEFGDQAETVDADDISGLGEEELASIYQTIREQGPDALSENDQQMTMTLRATGIDATPAVDGRTAVEGEMIIHNPVNDTSLYVVRESGQEYETQWLNEEDAQALKDSGVEISYPGFISGGLNYYGNGTATQTASGEWNPYDGSALPGLSGGTVFDLGWESGIFNDDTKDSFSDRDGNGSWLRLNKIDAEAIAGRNAFGFHVDGNTVPGAGYNDGTAGCPGIREEYAQQVFAELEALSDHPNRPEVARLGVPADGAPTPDNDDVAMTWQSEAEMSTPEDVPLPRPRPAI